MQHPTPPINKEKLSQLMDGEWHELNPSDCVAGICGDEALRAKWARYHLIRDAMNNEPVQSDLNMVSRICSAIADEPEYSNITPFSPAGVEPTRDATQAQTYRQIESQTGPNDAADEHAYASTAVAAMSTAASSALPSAPPSAPRSPSIVGTGVAGFALAASVAVVTVVGMNVWQGQGASPVDGSVVASRAVSGVENTDAFSLQLDGAPLPVVEFVANTGSYWVSPQTAERVNNEEKLNMFLSQHIENSPTSVREGLLPYSRLVGYDERVQER